MYTKPQTLDASPSGDTVKTAIVSKVDVNATQIVADLNTHEALTATHGASGAIVGTTNTQTLTNKTLTAPTITGAGAIAGVFTGNITGNVTGNVTGDLTGNVTGNVTGNLTGNVTGNVTGDVTGNVTGAVTGNVTGNCSGSSGSCTGNSATATLATTATNVSGGSVSATTGVFSSQVQTANPLFSANVTATVENCTGINSLLTYYTLLSTSSPACNWTERTDRATNFSGGTFTAPVTGNYLFTGFINLNGVSDNNRWAIVHLVTSNRTYTVTNINSAGIGSLGAVGYGFSVIADMDTADTAYLEIVVYDETNAKTVDITTHTHFQGYLLP